MLCLPLTFHSPELFLHGMGSIPHYHNSCSSWPHSQGNIPPLNPIASEDWTGKSTNPNWHSSMREPRATQVEVQGKDKPCSGKVANPHQETNMDRAETAPTSGHTRDICHSFLCRFWIDGKEYNSVELSQLDCFSSAV